MSSTNLYETDILAWSEQQAARLRRVAENDRQNADAPDWENVIEEIESVGRSQLSTVRSKLVRALEHDLKAEAWPLSTAVPGWRAEARRFRMEAAEAFSSSMRHRIDPAALYRRALRLLPDTIDGQPPLPVPQVCEITLDEMLGEG